MESLGLFDTRSEDDKLDMNVSQADKDGLGDPMTDDEKEEDLGEPMSDDYETASQVGHLLNWISILIKYFISKWN